jgi:dTDP-4-dehydrorhamnose 3,5-epimerase/CDP-3, 6-dideoxy-D-glycero-D-glycero-4-hexulose-5-epimerase
MKLKKINLQDCLLFQMKKIKDERGFLAKPYDLSVLHDHALNSNFVEGLYTVSKKDVIRGMHYSDSHKLIYVSSGSILDVVLCLDTNSVDYGKTFSTILSSKNKMCLYVGRGYAHGFKSLEENTIVNYLLTTTYSPKKDKGYLWNSFGFDWQIENPIVSDKDALLPEFKLKKLKVIKNADWKKYKSK